MPRRPRPDDVAALYTEGVEAVRTETSNLSAEQWATPVCGVWSATETARHLVAVAGWYHIWLDRALNDELSRPFPGEDIDAHNARSLTEHDDLDGEDAVAVFVESAGAYLDRVRLNWDRPFSFPFGTVTVGLHAGVAATEWHLHAWDLSVLNDERHTPARPGELFVAAGLCFAEAEGGFKGAAIRTVVPLAARRSPWETLLRRSDRI